MTGWKPIPLSVRSALSEISNTKSEHPPAHPSISFRFFRVFRGSQIVSTPTSTTQKDDNHERIEIHENDDGARDQQRLPQHSSRSKTQFTHNADYGHFEQRLMAPRKNLWLETNLHRPEIQQITAYFNENATMESHYQMGDGFFEA